MPDFERVVKIGGKIVPIFSPGLDGVSVFFTPFEVKIIQGAGGDLAIGGFINGL